MQVFRDLSGELIALEQILNLRQQQLANTAFLYAVSKGRVVWAGDTTELECLMQQQQQRQQHSGSVIMLQCMGAKTEGSHRWISTIKSIMEATGAAGWKGLVRALGPFYGAPGDNLQVLASREIGEVIGKWKCPGTDKWLVLVSCAAIQTWFVD